MRHTTILFAVALSAAVLDYTVRNTDAAWTEFSLFQWAVFLSPTLYVALLTNMLLRSDRLLCQLPAKLSNIAAVLLGLYLATMLVQVFTKGQAVGSAWYSVVHPLYVSGIPAAALTLAVFFSYSSNQRVKTIIAFICALWILMPLGIDFLYSQQGGYRGPIEWLQIAVLGTTYDLIKHFAAIVFLFTILIAPVVLVYGGYRLYREKKQNRLRLSAATLSIFTLTVQFWNWGRFVWD